MMNEKKQSAVKRILGTRGMGAVITAFSQRSSSFLLLLTPSLLQMRSRFGSARL